MANPTSRGQQRDKPFRDALRMELAAAGDDHKLLRAVAVALIGKATDGEQEILDIQPDSLHQRSPLFIGSADMMSELEECLRAKSFANENPYH